jgi:D-alanyl-D-alanine carboxypeptidase (penicillin-binding protein 5/6)
MWPQRGQAALVLGNGRPAASPHEQPLAIASLAKVMTAYLTLERYPLSGAQDGFTITVTEEQVKAQGQSVVAVQAGQQMTERQLLEALLIPSGNNIARMLATVVTGSEARFVAEMNAEACALGMDDTLAFFTHMTVGGHRLTAVGVVMGQGQSGDTSVILAAAGEAARQLVESAQN